MVALASTTFMTTSAILNGADPAQTIGMAVMGAALSFGAGAVAGSVATTPMGAILGGGISGAFVSGMMGVATGQSGSELGKSIFMGAFQGAAMAAIAYGGQETNPISEDSVAKQSGGGDAESTFYSGRKIEGSRYQAASGKTALLYGDPAAIMDDDGNEVWSLTKENRASYERALRRAVKEELGLSVDKIARISDEQDISNVLKSGNYRNVVYVGHSMNLDQGTGMIMPSSTKVGIFGSELAGALPRSVKNFYFLGCDPTGIATEAGLAAPGINFNPGSSSLLKQIVDFNLGSKQVTNVSFQPYE